MSDREECGPETIEMRDDGTLWCSACESEVRVEKLCPNCGDIVGTPSNCWQCGGTGWLPSDYPDIEDQPQIFIHGDRA